MDRNNAQASETKPAFSSGMSETWVARELDKIIAVCGRPSGIVSDNGTELTSTAILAWSDRQKVAWHHIAPGKPVHNAFIESFNGRLATSCGTKPCSGHCRMPAWRSIHGAGITIADRMDRCFVPTCLGK